MGKNSNKSKSSWKNEERIRFDAACEVVSKANRVEDPLIDFPAFHKFERNGLVATLECKNVDMLDQDTLDWIFKLEKANMEDIYNSCSWKWNDEKKLNEMTEKSAKYLIARSKEGQPIAFSHFRFDMDFGDEVLYCYELQLDPKVHRRGLGKFMLQLLELIAFKNDMRKVVLTVLKHNTNAVNFFNLMRYTTDCTNPEENVHETIPYEILSKINKNLPPYDFETPKGDILPSHN